MGVIVFIPFRWRIVLSSRTMGTIYHDYTDFLVFVSDILLIATLFFWGLNILLNKNKVGFHPISLFALLVLFTIFGAISILSSIDAPLSTYHFLRLLTLLGFYLYISNEIKSISKVIAAVHIQVVLQSIVGISQVIRQSDIGLQALGEYELNPVWLGVSIIAGDDVRWLRAYGLSDHPNILGGCIALSLLVILGWYLSSNNKYKHYSIGIFILGNITLLMTFSRAAWLGLTSGVILIFYFYYRSKDYKKLKLGFQLILITTMVLTPFLISYNDLILNRVGAADAFNQEYTEQKSIAERTILNNSANQIFVQNPIWGVGLGALSQAIGNRLPNLTFYAQPAHIVLLNAVAEIGLFGGFTYAAILALPWLIMIFDKRIKEFSGMITASSILLGITIIGLFDYYPWLLSPGRLWQYLAWGLWAVEYQSARKVVTLD